MSYQKQPASPNILIVGLGKTGDSSISYFVGLGFDVTAVDSRAEPPYLDKVHSEFPQVDTHCGPFQESLFTQFQQVLLSPGVPFDDDAVQSAVANGADVFGDVELFARVVSKRGAGNPG